MKHKLSPLIDCDSLVYAVGFASDTAKDDDGNPIDEPLSHCLHSLKLALINIVDLFEGEARVFIQGQGNYRDRIATIQPYKGNRDPSKRPRYFDEIREYLVDYWGAEKVEGKETDDMVSTLQWAAKDRSTAIVSQDKDLRNTPGWHYHYRKKELTYVTLAEANKNFWLQVLTGDQTDNVRGVPKVGPKTAEKILHGITDWCDLHNAVWKTYQSKGIGREEFHETASLVWMQREHMINYDGSKIEFGTESYEEDSEESVAPQGADENTTLA